MNRIIVGCVEKNNYVDEAETPELWIACDLCDVWYCGTCEHLTSVPEEEDTYICSKCA